MTQQYLPRDIRTMITISVMAAAVMNQVDTTIANVALPHMQGTTSASREQITWVLTSYILAMAITTPLTGWLAERYGRKRLLLISVVGFTLVSGLCGISVRLDELIVFRFLQGMSGASMIPISQVILMDLNPPEERGRSMAIFGLGFILGPLIGPLLGGWLTENFSWHWVFLINLPVGIAAFVGISTFLPESREENPRPFDLFGFALLALGLGAFQMMLDRGQTLDWFHSTEISLEAGLSALSLFLFVVHALTTKHPFVRFAIFADRNFAVSTLLGFVLGVLMFGTISLLPPLLAGLYGQPIFDVGVAMAPRGLGTFCATLIVGRLVGKADVRILLFIGLFGCGLSSLALSSLSLQSDSVIVMSSGFINGFAMSFVFVPLSTTMFATLPRRFYNEASALSTLIRYMGSAAGISAVQFITTRNAAIVQSRLTEGLTPDNPIWGWARPDIDLTAVEGAARAVGETARQALMVSYIDTFWMLALLGMGFAPLVFLIRTPKQGWARSSPENATPHAE
ncbi:MAG: DHA2 family efflux MFS transporter permease subunit [Novosphingobium sp.]